MTRPSSPAEKLLLESRAIVLNSDQREIVLAELEGLRREVAEWRTAALREAGAFALWTAATESLLSAMEMA